ncbi:MAG: hypothetical protein J6B81_05300 [Spirochaetaceae bacterium]|nr:hypothetical protein [Spirochaetaceae bacterium]
MKRIVFVVFTLLIGSILFAASYVDNEYQRLANSYTAKAEEAFEEGEYDLAVEYTAKAEENAELSRAYIEMMLARADADTQIRVARNRLTWARGIKADVNYPMAYSAGVQAVEDAQAAFESEDYVQAYAFAQAALLALSEVKELVPLPKYYVVRPWAETKDCYWNISGRSYVYGNPLLWENLYQANKSNMEDPNNPDLIHPGMRIEIPSIHGELREGTYNPSGSYTPSANQGIIEK